VQSLWGILTSMLDSAEGGGIEKVESFPADYRLWRDLTAPREENFLCTPKQETALIFPAVSMYYSLIKRAVSRDF
jgi:hypothetical protein